MLKKWEVLVDDDVKMYRMDGYNLIFGPNPQFELCAVKERQPLDRCQVVEPASRIINALFFVYFSEPQFRNRFYTSP